MAISPTLISSRVLVAIAAPPSCLVGKVTGLDYRSRHAYLSSRFMKSSEIDSAPFGPPMIGALLRIPWEAVQRHMLERLHESGFDDFDPAYLSVARYPGPQGMTPWVIKAPRRASVTRQWPSFISLETASKLTKYNPKSRTVCGEVYAPDFDPGQDRSAADVTDQAEKTGSEKSPP